MNSLQYIPFTLNHFDSKSIFNLKIEILFVDSPFWVKELRFLFHVNRASFAFKEWLKVKWKKGYVKCERLIFNNSQNVCFHTSNGENKSFFSFLSKELEYILFWIYKGTVKDKRKEF